MGRDQAIKVVHLISGDLWAGAEVQAYTLLKALCSRQDVEISAIVLNKGILADRLREADIAVTVIEESAHSFLAIRRQLIRELEGRSIDILHSHRYKENILAAQAMSRCGVKHLVQTVHGVVERFSGLDRLKAGMHSKMNRYFSRKFFDRIIAVSEDIRKRLSETCNEAQLVVIRNAIDTADIVPTRPPATLKAELGIRPERVLIGTAGRLAPVKGYDRLIRVAAIVKKEAPQVCFLIAGEGALRAELQRLIEDLDLHDTVRLVGFREDITDFLNSLDLCVMSSHHEGIPTVLLEGMYLRKPVVAMAVGGIPEVVEDGVSGMLIEAGNEAALADAILSLVRDRDLANRLGQAARSRVELEFSSRTLAQRILDLYQTVTGRQG